VLMGFAMVFMSLLALPVLMRFFTWTTGHVADSSGGGGFLQTALGGAVAIGALRGGAFGFGGSSAVEQARLVANRLGPPDTSPVGATSAGAGFRQASAPPTSAGAASAGTSRTAAAATRPSSAAGAGAGSAAAGSAAGPAGVAAAGLAVGAASARRKATEITQPPETEQKDH